MRPDPSCLQKSAFSLFTCYLFLFVEEADIMSYTNGNSLYACSENVDEETGKILFDHGFQTIS